jgi:hypothetical protein
MMMKKEKELCNSTALIKFDCYDVMDYVVRVLEKHDVLIPVILSIAVSITTVLLLAK